MSVLISKRAWPALLAALILACAVGLTTRSGAKAESGQPPQARLTGYTAPTGPELEPLAAARAVAGKYARQAGQLGELEVSVARASFAEAVAVTDGKDPSEAETTSDNAEIAEWRASAAYLVVIKATAPNATFAPNVPTPRGRSGPTGAVMSLIIDSHTGFVEGQTIGPSTPKLSALGSVLNTRIAAIVGAAGDVQTAALGAAPRPGLLIGKVYVGQRVAKGWHVLVAHSRRELAHHAILAARTGGGGSFTIPLTAGEYLVAAVRPNGERCGVRTARIVHHNRTHVVLKCDG